MVSWESECCYHRGSVAFTPDGKITRTAAGGTFDCLPPLLDQIIVELNAAHSKSAMGLHDVYEPL